ncbi:hypothetical protein EBU95_20860 [bacterium]|nr:hypothetical protein [bacterium]
MAAAIHNFLNYITSKWGRDIPLKNLWTVKFDNLTQVSQSVSNILRNTENGSIASNNTHWPVVNFSDDQHPEHGLFVAQAVALPTDSFAITNSVNTNMNGLKSAYIGGERTPYAPLTIEFLETNIDIIDHFFRPWIIAASHKGLIEDNDNKTNIKTTIRVDLYSRINKDLYKEGTSSKTWQRRKTYVIEGAVPTNVEGDKLMYTEYSSNDLRKSVSFAYKNYYIDQNPDILKTIGKELPASEPVNGINDSLLKSVTQDTLIKTSNTSQPIPSRVFVV